MTLQDFINVLMDEAGHFNYYWTQRRRFSEGYFPAEFETVEEWRKEYQRWRKEQRQGVREKNGWR